MAHSAPHSLAPAAGFVSPALSQRVVSFALIVAFHIVLIYLFASGLATSTYKMVFEPALVFEVPEVPEVPVPPPPRDLSFVQPIIDTGPPPDEPVYTEAAEGGTAITPTRTDLPPIVQPAEPRVEPLHLVGRHQLPNTEDYYPPTLRRLGVEGATSVSVCVDERGKRTGPPTVTESSGNARLDEGALDVARAGRYARSARGETFVPNCYGFRIIFKMQ